MTPFDLNQQVEQWLLARASSFEAVNRPFITLSYAQSWDGSLTTRRGDTLCLSGQESMKLTHQLRSLHDGILVGVGTVLSDDPQLTVREWSGPNPQPIVLDSNLSTPQAAKICNHPDKQCWILTVRPDAKPMGGGVEILTLPGADESLQEVPLKAAMSLLRERGIKRLMVEGGATVITAMLKARLADAIVMTVAPLLVGGYKAVGDLQSEGVHSQLRIQPLHTAIAGSDVVVWGDLQYGGDQ